MGNEVTTEEIKKTKVFSKWVILHSINLLIASLWNIYFSRDKTFQTEIPTGIVFETLGVFSAFMSVTWIIALIHRVIKKKSSTPFLFGIYYFITFVWFFYVVTWGIISSTTLNINLWLRFQDDNRAVIIFSLLILLFISFGFRLILIRATCFSPTTINAFRKNDINDKNLVNSLKLRKSKYWIWIFLTLILLVSIFWFANKLLLNENRNVFKNNYSNIQKIDTFWGLSLGTSMDKIKTLKGNPAEEVSDSWLYRPDDKHSSVSYILTFKDSLLTVIDFSCGDSKLDKKWNGDIASLSLPTSDIISRFGEPSIIKYVDVTRYYSDDTGNNFADSTFQKRPIYYYKKLNLFFNFYDGKVEGYGLFNPETIENNKY